jgi:hypothetical protein
LPSAWLARRSINFTPRGARAAAGNNINTRIKVVNNRFIALKMFCSKILTLKIAKKRQIICEHK